MLAARSSIQTRRTTGGSLKVAVGKITRMKGGESYLNLPLGGDTSREGNSTHTVVVRPHLSTIVEIKAPVVPRATDSGGFPITNVFNIT